MKIYEVIVDKAPKSCAECDLVMFYPFSSQYKKRLCALTKQVEVETCIGNKTRLINCLLKAKEQNNE